MNKFLVLFLLFNILIVPAYSNESRYSQSLSRMEREWLHKEFDNEDDELRLSRLEEKVFGTIHDVDTETRYKQLRKAFNVRKLKHHKINKLYGNPTGIPSSIDDLINN